MSDTLAWGRETCGDLGAAESREWLCTNGVGGFASGTVAGTPTRRYHGLLVAALDPPLGRTLLAAQVHETVAYDGQSVALATSRWSGGAVAPDGYRQIESFRVDGTTPVWTYACGDALVEKRIWMEPGASTTYVRYAIVRARGPVGLALRVLVNHRDYHATTRAGDWRMDVTPVEHGVRVTAFDGACPVQLLAAGAEARPAHAWFRDFDLAREAERGLDHVDDALHAVTFEAELAPGASLTLVASVEAAPALDGEAAWRRRAAHEGGVLRRWMEARPESAAAPGWVPQLVLAADQFIVRRPTPDDPDGLTVMAGYHWFGDWGRDTMIALAGLTLTTGRPAAARSILTTFARFVDRGMLPNRFPDAGEPPEYNTVDATLWYFEAIRAYHEATGDDGLLEDLFGVLESIVAAHRQGTRYGIRVDPADGLLASGEPGVQLTWMDARVGDRVVTPRTGKPVEVNALWYNALRAMAVFATRLGRPASEYCALADRVAAGFERFWHAPGGHCHDVIDTPAGDDPTLRPNQILAVSLPESPLPLARQRAVVDAVGARLLTSYGLRSLAPGHPDYRGRYGGDPWSRDGAYHQGTVWAWLLGPFALAHFRVYRDARAARSFLLPLADHLGDYGVGSIAEIFDGDAPFRPGGCIAQAWSVAEVLRAWHEVARGAEGISSRQSRGRLRGHTRPDTVQPPCALEASAMCVDNDSRPPIAPIAGGSAGGRDLKLTSADGTRFMAYAARAARPTGAGMLVIPDVRGLHQYYKDLADRFAEVGVDSVAVDFFARTADTEDRGEKFEFMPHVGKTTPETLQADFAAAIAYLRSPEGGQARSLFSVGFCFGGALSYLQAASGLGYAGVIGFYGWPLGLKRWPDRPRPIDAVSRYACPVLSIFGGADEGIPPADVDQFDGALRKAGVKHDQTVYPGAPHSFFDRKFTEFADASADAWKKVQAFVSQNTKR